MEVITALVASLLMIASPVGAIVDHLAEDAIRAQLAGAEQLQVRIDNVPNYQLLNGRVEHVRVAGRGIFPVPELRIDTLDLETDPIDVDLPSLQRGQLKLDAPAQAAAHLILEADDINQFLQSAPVQVWLDQFRFNLPGQYTEREGKRYGLVNPKIEFLEGDRLRLVVDLQDRILNESLAIEMDLQMQIVDGHRLQILDPHLVIDGVEAPPQLINTLVEGANQQLTLRSLEPLGVTARILDFQIRNNELDLAVFAKVDPSSPFLTRP